MSNLSLKEKTARGIFWGGFNIVGQQIVQLCFGIFMARLLTPGDYGIVGMLTVFTLVAGIFQEGGFTTALINKKNPTPEDFSSVFWLNVLISLFLYFILFFSAEGIAGFFDKPVLVSLSRIIFLSFVFNSLGIVQNAILTKELAVKKLAIVNLSTVVVSGIIGLVLALRGLSYWAVAIQAVSASGIKTVMLWNVNKWRPSFLFSGTSIKKMLPFSMKLLLAVLVNQIAQNLYFLLLGKYYDEKQVGYYSQGNRWYNVPFGLVFGMINTIAFPVLATVNDNPEKQRSVFRKMVQFTAFVSFPVILGFAFVSEELIVILITDKWIESVPIIRLLCIWGAFLPLLCLYTNILTSNKHTGIGLIVNVAYGILLILALLSMVNRGIIFMLVSNLVINFFYLGSYVIIVKCVLSYAISDFFKDISPFLLISVMSFALTYIGGGWIENSLLLLLYKIVTSFSLYIVMIKLFNIAIFNEISLFLKSKIIGNERN